MMDKKRLMELKKYVQCIRTNGWVSLTKSDDLLTLIDAALTHEATTDTEVQAAIDVIEKDGKFDEEISMAFGVPRRPPEVYALVIRALQQYRTEPCEKCQNGTKPRNENLHNYEMPWLAKYCDQCGRKLKGA